MNHEMLEDNKELFRKMLAAFLDKHVFELPMILAAEEKYESRLKTISKKLGKILSNIAGDEQTS